MSGPVAAGLLAAVLGGGICVGVFWWAFRRAQRTYSKAVVQQLKATGQPVVIRVSDRRGTWNPAKREVSGRLFANGRAVYRLDGAEVVHLEFYPDAGGEKHYEGPVPAWHDSPDRRRRQRMVRHVWLGYLVWLVAGFVVGYLLVHGSTGKRLLVGVAGIFIAMVLASIATTAVRVAIAVRTAGYQRTRSK